MAQVTFSLRALQERLWVKPLTYALSAAGLVALASVADQFEIGNLVPNIGEETIEKLLTVLSASMLGVATFAVASMVAAYAAAGGSATPRAFALVVADSMSQTALSSFVGAFIFSIVGIVAIETSLYGEAGRFVLFSLTLAVFGWVVLTFVRWVDNVARLGRLGNTIARAEKAAAAAFARWTQTCGPIAVDPTLLRTSGHLIYPDKFGYIQHIDLPKLQGQAETTTTEIDILAPVGAFVSPGRALASIVRTPSDDVFGEDGDGDVRAAFVIDDTRSFSDDPRFGLIVLSEIASRALSPAVNDPGTAIDIINRITRVLMEWDAEASSPDRDDPSQAGRVRIASISAQDLLEDAFGAVAKDGVGSVEVGVRLQKAFALLARAHQADLRTAAAHYSALSLQRAAESLSFAPDLARVRAAATLLDHR